jgi:lysophospholipase L1-like esterase
MIHRHRYSARLCAVSLFLLVTPAAVHAQAVAAPPAPVTDAAHKKWEPEIAAFEKADREHPPEKGGVLFIGSSSIRLWKSLAADFPKQHILNRGFGGSQIEDSIYFADRIVFPYAPRLIVMYAGGNDINAGKSVDQVVKDFETFAGKVHAQLPDTEIAYISIAGNPARWAQVDKVKAVNARIAAMAKTDPKVKFIDVFTRMLGPDGMPRPEIFSPDRLHMNEAGYKLWKEIVGPYLD